MSEIEPTTEAPGLRGDRGHVLRFSPTIELGHVLQAGVVLLMVGGWALVGYQTIQKQLDQNAAELLIFKQRMTTDEAAMAEQREALRSAVSETRQFFTKIADQIADLRALVASQGKDGARR